MRRNRGKRIRERSRGTNRKKGKEAHMGRGHEKHAKEQGRVGAQTDRKSE